MTALFLYHSITPCTSEGDISASAMLSLAVILVYGL